MSKFCSSTPCLAQQANAEIQIPLIYQNPETFYSPHEMATPLGFNYHHAVMLKDFRYDARNSGGERNRMSMRVGSSRANHASNSQLNNLTHKELHCQDKIKQNASPICFKKHMQVANSSQNRVCFNNHPVWNQSSQKQEKTAINSLHSFQVLTHTQEQKQSQSFSPLDIVPTSEHNSLLQNNRNLKRIIQQEYQPLKNCYQNLRQEQTVRQQLILILQRKVRQLGQQLNSQSLGTSNYSRY